ncbi:Ciao1 [Carabus blaptoides fortunei]
MNELVVPPSPNWYRSSIIACAPDNTVIYGARQSIVIIKPTDPSEAADIQMIYLAHSDKVTAISLHNSSWGNPDKTIVSIGEDRIVRLWNINTCSLINYHKGHEINSDALADVSLLKDRVITVSELGYIIIWSLATNTQVALPDIFKQKVRIRCMSSCPHMPWLTAFGLNSGIVFIVDLRKHGNILYRLRGNDGEITSLSWCPATYNIFKTPKGILIDNCLKSKSDKGKYVAKKAEKQKQNSEIKGKFTDNVVNPANLNIEASNVHSEVEINEEQVERKSVQTLNDTKNIECKPEDDKLEIEEIHSNFEDVLSNESFKNIITSGENIDLDDAPAVTNLEYKPKQRKANLLKPKIDKNNPWGGLLFNDSDEEEQQEVEDRDERPVPIIVNDYLKECSSLRTIILREDSDIFRVRTDLVQTVQIEDIDSSKNNITQEDSLDDAKIVGEQFKKKEKYNVPEEKENTVLEEQVLQVDSSDAILPEVERKIEHIYEKGIAENLTQKADEDDVISLKSDLSSVTNSLKQLELENEKTCEKGEDQLPETEYLLAAACKGGNVCIWRAGTDGRIQLQLQTVNKRASRYNDKKTRWISLCWVKPDLLVTTSYTNEVYSWDLLPDIDTENKLTKDSVYKARLIHSDHRRNIFSIATPYKLYSSADILVDWRASITDLIVWTVSQDRWVFCTSLNKYRDLIVSYPTMGGYVSHIAVSPVDPNKIAIGVGDASIRLLDLSKPHKQVIVMSCLWEKVKSRVLQLDWHPVKENLVAFATTEGRVGEFDAYNTLKSPVIFSNYHRNQVHALQWGPLPNSDDGIYGLYSSSGGELVVHDATKPIAAPSKISLPESNISTFAWKSDYSVLAIGTKDGVVKLLSKEFIPYLQLYMQRKTVQCIVWHPESTIADCGMSPFANDIAVATNDSIILVYRLSMPEQHVEGDEKSKGVLVASLQGHTLRVRSLAWCPHIGGRLASCSEDGTAMVWDVPSQTVLAIFTGHSKDAILTIVWSPLDADLIISGGKDSTLRIWRITKYPPTLAENVADKKGKKRSPKLNKIDSTESPETKPAGPEKNAKINLLPCVSRMQNPEQIFHMETFRKLLYKLDHPDDVPVQEDSDTDEEEEDPFLDTGLPNFNIDPIQMFGSKDDMAKVLEYEQQTHIAKKHWDHAHHLSLFKGDIAKSIRTALKAGVMNPWIISMAPMVSMKLWLELCTAYAEKLADEGKGLLACSYYLAVHKADLAIESLCKSDMYKEALALTKCRFPRNDKMIWLVLDKWAKYSTHIGNFELAAQCYIKLGKLSEAAQLLNRRTDVASLEMAAELAKRSSNQDLLHAVNLKLEMLKSPTSSVTAEVGTDDQTTISIHESRYAALLAHIKKEVQNDGDDVKSDDTSYSLKEETLAEDYQQSSDVDNKTSTEEEKTISKDLEQNNDLADKFDDNASSLKNETVTEDKPYDNIPSCKEEIVTEDFQQSKDVAGKSDDNTCSLKEETVTEDYQQSSDFVDNNTFVAADKVSENSPQ